MVKVGFAFTDPLRVLSHSDKQESRPNSADFKSNSKSHCFAHLFNHYLYRATVAGIAALFAPATVSLPGTQCDCSDKYPGL